MTSGDIAALMYGPSVASGSLSLNSPKSKAEMVDQWWSVNSDNTHLLCKGQHNCTADLFDWY